MANESHASKLVVFSVAGWLLVIFFPRFCISLFLASFMLIMLMTTWEIFSNVIRGMRSGR